MAILTEIKKKTFHDTIHNFIHRLILYTTDRKHQAGTNSRYTSHSNKKIQSTIWKITFRKSNPCLSKNMIDSDIFEIIQERKELEGNGFHHSKEGTQRHLLPHNSAIVKLLWNSFLIRYQTKKFIRCSDENFFKIWENLWKSQEDSILLHRK